MWKDVVCNLHKSQVWVCELDWMKDCINTTLKKGYSKYNTTSKTRCLPVSNYHLLKNFVDNITINLNNFITSLPPPTRLCFYLIYHMKASEPYLVNSDCIQYGVNPEKNINQGGSRHKCIKGLLSSYIKLMHCWNLKLP